MNYGTTQLPQGTELRPDNNGTSGHQFIPLSDAGFIVMGCMLSITWCCGSFFNGLCLFIFATKPQLRSPTNIFIIALNLCDFLMCFFGTPGAMASAWAHRWLWGDAACDMEGFTVYFLGLASMYILMAIAITRYIAITKPLLAQKVSTKVALISCGCCYLAGFLWAILPAFGWNEFALEGAGISCSVVWQSNDPAYMSYIWAIFFCCLIMPVGVMLYSYLGILATLRQINRNSVWKTDSQLGQRNLAIEKNILKTSVLIVLSFVFFWTPYTVVSFVTAFFGAHHIPTIFATIPPAIAKCQGLFDPIIYVATNSQVRTEVFKMLPCRDLKQNLLNHEVETAKRQGLMSSFEKESSKKNSPSFDRSMNITEDGRSEQKMNRGKEKEVERQQHADKGDLVENGRRTAVRYINQPGSDDVVLYFKREGEDSV